MKEKRFTYLSVLLCFYCVFAVIQNIFEMKTIGTANLAIMGGGTVVSWIPFMAGDIITEVYGGKTNVKVFTLAGILNAIVVVFAQFVILLPGTYADQNEAFKLIFSNGLRTAVASLVAFWVGNFINTKVMISMKNRAKNENNKFLFFIRAVVSTIAGQFIDNGLFLLIAFAPIGLSVFEMRIVDIGTVTLTGSLLEVLFETVLVPFITIPITGFIKKSIN